LQASHPNKHAQSPSSALQCAILLLLLLLPPPTANLSESAAHLDHHIWWHSIQHGRVNIYNMLPLLLMLLLLLLLLLKKLTCDTNRGYLAHQPKPTWSTM
jgi:hypothetical protein